MTQVSAVFCHDRLLWLVQTYMMVFINPGYNVRTMWECRLSLQFTWILSSSGMLHSIGWLSTNILGLPTGPIFKGQIGPIGSPETSVCNQPMLHNIPEDDNAV
jgi:hypothetical protein